MMTNLRNSLQNVQSVSYYAYAAYEYVGYFWRAYFYFRYPRLNVQGTHKFPDQIPKRAFSGFVIQDGAALIFGF